MTNLSDREAAALVKLLYIGNSGTGKTGSLTSLVKAGYKLRIVDMDNGLDALTNHIRVECPDKLHNVEYQSFREKYKFGPTGPIIVGAPRAFVRASQALDKWDDGTRPADWGPDYFLVIDSLTNLSRAAFDWVRAMAPTAKGGSQMDGRQWYKSAQDAITKVLSALVGEDFKTNVIIISHIDYREKGDGRTEGFVSTIGKALGPHLPKDFNTLILAEQVGIGNSVRRRIKTLPTHEIALKNPAPMRIKGEYPLESGLATIVEKLKETTT